MSGLTTRDEIHSALNKEVGSLATTVLVIDGTALDIVLSHSALEKQFFEIATACPAVAVCRCSPTQKSIIVKKVKALTSF